MATGIAETAFDRDGLARWYAKRHLETDAGVEKIYYLPTNAPPREIRLLEVNGMISETEDPEPIDFGVNVGGADGHTLFVLDLTPAQWEAVRQAPSRLPAGWNLDGAQELAKR